MVGGPLPLLAEGLGGGSPPLLAGVRRPQRWVSLRVVVSRVVSACGAACARGVCGVCSWCLCWWWCGCGRAFRARVCVCVCVCVWCPVWCDVVFCWGFGWCVLWLVPRHFWRRFLCATPRHSWLGFAAGGGGCSSPLLAEGPGCGSPPLLAGVRRRWWCATPRHSWLGFAAGGGGCSSPLLAEGLGCGSPPLLAGVRLRWWCAAPRHSWLGPSGCGGVFRGWTCSLLCVFVVCVAARGGRAVLCVVCLWCPRCWWCGVVVRWVCLPRALVCVVVCVWCAGGLWFVVPASCGWGLRLVFVWLWLVCGVGPPPLLAEGPGCCAPPPLAGVHSCAVVVGPLTFLAEGLGYGAPPLLAGVRRRVPWLVPHHSWPRAVGVVPRHSWLDSRVAFSLVLVCVCVLCGASCWCGWRAGVVRGVVGVCVCVFVCVRCVVCGVCHTVVGSRRQSAWSWSKSRRKAIEEVL